MSPASSTRSPSSTRTAAARGPHLHSTGCSKSRQIVVSNVPTRLGLRGPGTRGRDPPARARAASLRRSSAAATRRRSSPCRLVVERRAPRRPSASSRRSTCARLTCAVGSLSGSGHELGVALVHQQAERALIHRGQLASSRCTRRCRRGTGRARARRRWRGRTARGSPAPSESRRAVRVRTSTIVDGMPSSSSMRDDERRLVLAVAPAARDRLHAAARLEAVDAELERDVARVLDHLVVDGLAPSRASVVLPFGDLGARARASRRRARTDRARGPSTSGRGLSQVL